MKRSKKTIINDLFEKSVYMTLKLLSFASAKAIDSQSSENLDNIEAGQQVYNIIHLLGGIENINSIDAERMCLIIEVSDVKHVSSEELWQSNGAQKITIENQCVQILFGAKAEMLRNEIQTVVNLNHKIPPYIDVEKNELETKPPSQTKIETFVSPVDGLVIPITEVEDDIFSELMLGDGFGVKPDNGIIVSPISGTIVTVFETEHAVTILTPNGSEVLIHLGINTVDMEGDAFQLNVQEGQTIQLGDALGTMDLAKVEQSGRLTTVITAWSNHADLIQFELSKIGQVRAGDAIGHYEM
ncbi:PTS glucose transporter subunit IIA [Aerococcaceae bacterium DSM 111020]|nr:PTS glucose transporter subunit IIA [Aerococcaceae bacterium DSM 111020]